MIMNRVVARLPETVSELCLVRLGIQVKSLSAWLFARRLRRRSPPPPGPPLPTGRAC